MGASPQRRYEYKVFRSGVYLGSIQNVISNFGYNQNINSAGAQLMVTVGQSADVTDLPPDPIRDETGDPVLDETGDIVYDEQAAEIVGDSNDNILIRNDNDIQVWEFTDDHINGVIVYSGYISKWKGTWGGDDDIIITCLNHSQDLTNYITPGSVVDTLDQQQTSVVLPSDGYPVGGFYSGGSHTYLGQGSVGQTIVTGAGVSNISAIEFYLTNLDTACNLVVSVFNSPSEAVFGAPLGQATLAAAASGSAAIYRTVFSVPVSVTPLTSYFICVTVDSTVAFGGIGDAESDIYGPGSAYTFIRGYGALHNDATDDLYFKTFYSHNSTTVSYTNKDPSTTLTTVIDYYRSLGGDVSKPPGGYALTGTIVPQTSFKINTILEAIQRIVTLAPSDWYWYIDPATEILYFQQTSATVQHRFIKGVHLEKVTIEATKEEIVNIVYFSGGKVLTENLFVLVQDSQSLTQNRRGVARLSDSTVTDTSTAQLIAQNYIDQHNEQTYTTTIIIPFAVYDVSTLDIGDIVAFAGMGWLVDALQLQIVGKALGDADVTLTLGVLLPRQTALGAQLRQELTALQTVDNPDTPS